MYIYVWQGGGSCPPVLMYKLMYISCLLTVAHSTLSKYMREHKLGGVPHGFRSTLRTWLTDHTDISYEIAEMIIAHQVGSQVERAYNRTDYLEQRRHYMELWAGFLTVRKYV